MEYIDVNTELPKRGGIYDVKLNNGSRTHVPYTRKANDEWIWLIPSEFKLKVTHWREIQKQ